MATEEQHAYARLLDWCGKAAILVLVVTFIIYLLGILTPHVPIEELPAVWGMSAGNYLKTTGMGPGWTWLGMIGKGDYLNLIGIALLASVTVICYLRIVPIFLRKGETAYGLMALLEILVLMLAASGTLRAR